jgi:polyribonucleotide nucleotidyltransferase
MALIDFRCLIKVNSAMIGRLIGSKGATVKSLIEISGVDNISINDKGMVDIVAPDDETMKKALALIEATIAEVEEGATYRCLACLVLPMMPELLRQLDLLKRSDI